MTDRHTELIDRITTWAADEDNIRVLILTGSTTRGAGTSDRFSDRDIEIIATDPAPLLADDAWIRAIAPVWVALYLENGVNDPETRLVFFEGGRKVDFVISSPSRLTGMIEANRLDGLYERGYRVLMDKDGITADLPEPTGSGPKRSLPTQSEFADTVTEFWFEAAHMPTYLVREDLWVVKTRDWTMKDMLLRMLEWHALATSGPNTDTWYIGTKMKRWVDAATWREVHDVFGRFDRADSWRGLTAMMRLFTRLTHETASVLGLSYPEESERHITDYVLGFEEEIGELASRDD